MKSNFLSTLVCLPVLAFAQDISGKWEGNFTPMIDMLQMEKLVVDIQVYDDTLITGSSHLYYPGGQYEHYTIVGTYDPVDSTIFFMEDNRLAVNVGMFNTTCLGNYMMKLTVKDSVLRQDGKWKDNAKGFSILKCPSSKVFLEKKQLVSKPVVQVKRDDANLKRKGEIQKLIEVGEDEKDSIKIELLDNAQIDNDIVSVYLDDSLVLRRQKLTADPQAFYITLSKSLALCSIKMVAESMGSIPPCTALMIVSTKKSRYNVTLSSDFGNNGVLQLFLKD